MMDIDIAPVFMPEDPVPAAAENCGKCELCHQKSRMIGGEGNPQAPILVVLDNPGAREDAEGNPFFCGTRQTLQLGAFKASISLNDLYITYILKCRPLRRYAKETARNTCMEYLLYQLQVHMPEAVLCLGNTAAQWFFGDMTAEVKNLRGRWHQIRGVPTIVSYHPLAVRRRPNLTLSYYEDWGLLARWFYSS